MKGVDLKKELQHLYQPSAKDGPTVERVHEFTDSGGKRREKHNEVYLSDIRKANPAKCKTIISQPLQ
jgi:hypothetical protein